MFSHLSVVRVFHSFGTLLKLLKLAAAVNLKLSELGRLLAKVKIKL